MSGGITRDVNSMSGSINNNSAASMAHYRCLSILYSIVQLFYIKKTDIADYVTIFVSQNTSIDTVCKWTKACKNTGMVLYALSVDQ